MSTLRDRVPALPALLLPVLIALMVTACSGADAGDEPSSPDSGSDSFPVTVSTKFGDVEITSAPQRIVALGWGDAETALALGVQPVGASDWIAFGGEGVGPWAEGLYDSPPEIIGTLDPSYEAVAALRPDLILDVKSSGDQERFDTLSAIAPTVGIPEGGDNYVTGIDQQVTMIATALGHPEKGKELLDGIANDFEEATEAHPEFADKTVTVAAFTSEGWGAYIAETDRVRFMEKLGFRNNPVINEAEPERFSVRISSEQMEMLDADLVVVMPIGKTAEDVEAQPLFKAVPAVKDGRYVIFDSSEISGAYALNSPLSIKYALDQVTPLLAEKVK